MKMNKFLRRCCVSFLTRTCRVWPTKLYLGLLCRARLGYRIDWNNPRTFNEKLQWLKVYYRDPLYPTLVDKYLVKEYVANKLGHEYIIPNLGVWDSFDEIDFSRLPSQFALKCTHDSGGIVLCRDKESLDIPKAIEKINKSLKYDFYYLGREWPYKLVEHKILAEELLTTNDGEDLKDYKFFCFNGVVKCFVVDFDRFTNHRSNYYDAKCQLMDIGKAYMPPDFERNVVIPANIDEMIAVSEKLSKDMPFVRVDLYNIDGKVYFGEMTFFPGGGTSPFTSYQADLMLGDWIALPPKSELK